MNLWKYFEPLNISHKNVWPSFIDKIRIYLNMTTIHWKYHCSKQHRINWQRNEFMKILSKSIPRRFTAMCLFSAPVLHKFASIYSNSYRINTLIDHSFLSFLPPKSMVYPVLNVNTCFRSSEKCKCCNEKDDIQSPYCFFPALFS